MGLVNVCDAKIYARLWPGRFKQNPCAREVEKDQARRIKLRQEISAEDVAVKRDCLFEVASVNGDLVNAFNFHRSPRWEQRVGFRLPCRTDLSFEQSSNPVSREVYPRLRCPCQ